MIVHSLVCWGGRTGKTVTASNSSGLIFTTSGAHGLRDGTALQFVATTLPGNVSAGTTYYAKSLTSTTFAIYTDYALTNRVAWSSAGSGQAGGRSVTSSGTALDTSHLAHSGARMRRSLRRVRSSAPTCWGQWLHCSAFSL